MQIKHALFERTILVELNDTQTGDFFTFSCVQEAIKDAKDDGIFPLAKFR